MKVTVALIFLACLLAFNVAMANPSATSSMALQPSLVSGFGYFQNNPLIYNLTKIQLKLNEKIATEIQELKHQKNYTPFFAVLAIAFIYGFFHVLGPGHGKSIISCWIISHRQNVNDVLLISAMAAVFHALTAVLIVGGTYILLGKFATISTLRLNEYLQVVAAVLIIGIGLRSIIRPIFGKFAKNNSCPEGTMPAMSRGNPLFIALSVGIVPCPVIIVIFIFSLTLGLIWQGISFVLSFAIGMGVSLVAVSYLVWFLKEKIKTVCSLNEMTEHNKMSSLYHTVTKVLPIMGGIFFVFIGSTILYTLL